MNKNKYLAKILLESAKELLSEGLSDKELFERAYKGDISILDDSNVAKIRDEWGYTPLHFLAKAGKIEILKHPDVARVKSKWGNTPLHLLARKGRIEVLKHPDVAKVKNNDGDTPLHWLAREGVIEVLKHPLIAKIKNKYGRTPLHLLAQESYFMSASEYMKILKHPFVAKVKDEDGRTPLHILAKRTIAVEVLNHPDAAKVKDNKGMTPYDTLIEAIFVNGDGYRLDWQKLEEMRKTNSLANNIYVQAEQRKKEREEQSEKRNILGQKLTTTVKGKSWPLKIFKALSLNDYYLENYYNKVPQNIKQEIINNLDLSDMRNINKTDYYKSLFANYIIPYCIDEKIYKWEDFDWASFEYSNFMNGQWPDFWEGLEEEH